MRLTLRTLLAYLDDRLPPSNAREIGQKITNSPFATELAERIREVKRRRRLASPAKPQQVIEANLIAEYLDDQLTPELVARVEREILSSDASLAEVAAAHEILGMIRDPVTVEPRLRDRLYGLDPTGAMDVVHALAAGQTARAVTVPVSKWSPLATRVAASRRLPGVIAAALGLLWLVSVVSDSDLLGRKQDAAGASAGKPESVENPVIADTGGQPGVPQDSVKPEATVANAATGGNSAETVAGRSLPDAASPGPANPDSEPASSHESGIAVAEPTLPVAVPPAAVAAEVVAAESVPDAAAAAVAVDENAEPLTVFLQADSRIVLSLNEQQNRWISLAQMAGGEIIGIAPNRIDCRPLLGRNWFGIPESFRVVVSTDRAGWSAALPGASLIRIHEGDLSGLDILSGRILLSADKAIAWNEQSPPRFALGTGSQTTVLTLQTPDTRLGIEVIALADGSESDPAAAVAEDHSILPTDADLQVRLTIVEGSIVLKSPGSDADLPMAKGQSVSWRILGMTGFSALTPENGSPLAATPAWLLGTETVDVPETVNLKTQLLEALSQGAEPGDAVLSLFDERNPQAGVLAVHVLSLTRDVERLLAVLFFEPRDETVHRAAIDGLSAIAASSGNGRGVIRRSLETRLPMAEVDSTLELIKGLSVADARDPDVTADLMELLSSDRLLTRELTIYRMEQVTNDRMGYHPAAEAARRREAIRRWQKYLDRNQGKLLP